MKRVDSNFWIILFSILTLGAAACSSTGGPNPPNPPNPPLPPPLTLNFGAPLSLAMGSTVPASGQTVYVGDFNGDGNLDFAVLNNTFGVFLGNGDGTFGPRLDATSIITSPVALTAGEFDGQPAQELVAAFPGTNQVDIFFDPDQDGNFAAPAPYMGGTSPQGVAVADFTGDDLDDIMLTDATNSNLYLKINQGAVTFNDFSYASPGNLSNPRNLVAADFDQDGNIDVAVANNGADFATVWFNSGNANPAFLFPGSNADSSLTMPAGSGAQGITAADLNDDGLPDLIVPSPGTKQAAVFMNQGGGSFGAANLLTAGNDPFSAAVADFDLDGNVDLIVPNAFGVDGTNGDFGVYLGDGLGNFAAPQFFTAGTDGAAQPNHPRSIAVGDFNGDNLPDVVMASDLVDQAVVVLNTSN